MGAKVELLVNKSGHKKTAKNPLKRGFNKEIMSVSVFV